MWPSEGFPVIDLLFHNQFALMFFPALLLSLLLTPIAIRYSFHLNAVDRPDARKVHAKAVSRLGGVAMVAGLVFPILFFTELNRLMTAFLAGLFLVSVTGFLDDIYHIPPSWKFVGEIAAAGTFVALSGMSIREFGNLFNVGELNVGPLGPALTVFCMVGVMNALNLSDGLDGLAGGIGAISCAFMGIFAYMGADRATLSILVALLGALFGFLRYNMYPANLFMGDTGSLLLGYTLSAVAVVLVRNDGTGVHLAPVTVAAVLALPITDTLLVMARRIRHGEHPFYPDRTHLHHRLLGLGFPHSAVVPILYLSTAAFGVQSWLLRSQPEWVQFAAVILLAVGVHGAVFVLQHSGFRWKGEERADRAAAERRENEHAYSWMAHIMGKSVRGAGWVIGFGLALPTIALPEVPRALAGAALATLLFVMVLFPWNSRNSSPAVSYGLMYLSCLCLLALLQAMPGAPKWIPGYLAALSAAVLGWVLLKMKYRGHREIVQISSFETLLLGIALLVSLMVVPMLGLGEELRKMMLTVCLESIAFLLAMKILIRRQARRNYVIAVAFMAALALIGLKGLLSQRTFTDFVAAPAGASLPISPHNPGPSSPSPPVLSSF
jgi:UDP-GlcNAc:undecaprenyl-phosphate/decaprenyl-phosphate GlcNAc-1-phosphate transferase